jgi:hypothetical protein
MRVSRSVLVAVAAWVLVVALGSTLVWAVISRAGDGVVTADSPTSADPTTETTGPTQRPTTRPTITDDPTSDDPTSEPPPATGSTAPPAATTAVRRSWQGLGGTVTVTCRGAAVSLDSAQPDSGFTIEVHERGPERVEVRFEGRGEEDDSKSRVRATCRAGVPVFEVD